MAISGVVGAIYKASGTSATFTTQAMTLEAGSGNLRYYITDRTKAYWDSTAVTTIEKSTNGGSSWAAITTGFTIEYAGGYIAFTVDQTTSMFRVTGKNFTVSAIGGGFNWSIDIEAETLEATTFLNNGWKSFIPSIRGFSGSFETYWSTGTTNFSDLGNVNMIIVLYTDVSTSLSRYEGYATFTKDSIETPNDNLVTDKVDFKSGGKLYYRVG